MRWFVSSIFLFCFCAAVQAEPGKPLDVPVAIGHDVQGIRIPITSPDGKLQLVFESEIAFRKDQQTLQFSDLRVETFDDNGKPEMIIEMPLSFFDLGTRVLTSEKPITIRRPDVEVTGDKLIFDTQKRQGKLTGQVRVRLLNNAKEDKP